MAEPLEAAHRRVRVDATQVKTPSAQAAKAAVQVVVLAGDEPLVEASGTQEYLARAEEDAEGRAGQAVTPGEERVAFETPDGWCGRAVMLN